MVTISNWLFLDNKCQWFQSSTMSIVNVHAFKKPTKQFYPFFPVLSTSADILYFVL